MENEQTQSNTGNDLNKYELKISVRKTKILQTLVIILTIITIINSVYIYKLYQDNINLYARYVELKLISRSLENKVDEAQEELTRNTRLTVSIGRYLGLDR